MTDEEVMEDMAHLAAAMYASRGPLELAIAEVRLRWIEEELQKRGIA